MDNFCTYLNLKDSICSNGFNSTSVKTYTNLQKDTVIELKLGYFFKVISTEYSTLSFQIYNNFFCGNFTLDVDKNKIYSLPCEGGCYILEVSYKKYCEKNICCESGM